MRDVEQMRNINIRDIFLNSKKISFSQLNLKVEIESIDVFKDCSYHLESSFRMCTELGHLDIA